MAGKGLLQAIALRNRGARRASSSPHEKNRICNNAKVTAQAARAGEYPMGAPNVKELYDDAGTSVIGYAVEVHIIEGTITSNWHSYELNPTLGAPAHNVSSGSVVDEVDQLKESPVGPRT